MQRFDAAPWTTTLKVMSAIGIGVLVVMAVVLFVVFPSGTRVPFAEAVGKVLLAVPPAIFVFALLFVVTGYDLDATGVYVRRLLWRTAIPLDKLVHAWYDPSAMSRSLRVFGNGGLFAFTGVFQNATLGRYRAFVTDPKESVVLRFQSRTVVLSPAHPLDFLGHLSVIRPGIVIARPATAG